MTTYFKRRNTHNDFDGTPRGRVTEGPYELFPTIACWSGQDGSYAANVLCGMPIPDDHDLCLPWSIRDAPRRFPYDAVEYHVLNARGDVVLWYVTSKKLAEEVCKMAAATKENP